MKFNVRLDGKMRLQGDFRHVVSELLSYMPKKAINVWSPKDFIGVQIVDAEEGPLWRAGNNDFTPGEVLAHNGQKGLHVLSGDGIEGAFALTQAEIISALCDLSNESGGGRLTWKRSNPA